jgi:hypothetical protein
LDRIDKILRGAFAVCAVMLVMLIIIQSPGFSEPPKDAPIDNGARYTPDGNGNITVSENVTVQPGVTTWVNLTG